MTDVLFFACDQERGRVWQDVFRRAGIGICVRLQGEMTSADHVRYLVCWDTPDEMMQTYPDIEAVICLGTGVDHIDLAAIPDHVRVVRMVEPGITQGMVEYVTMTAIMAHRDMLHYQAAQRRCRWRPHPVRMAKNRPVGIMGAGVLGKACASRLLTFGFPVNIWNRRPSEISGVVDYATNELTDFCQHTDILVCLLPLTPETRGILNKGFFDLMKYGSYLINVSRGGTLVESDLVDALDSGKLAGAFLDVTEQEPLPPNSPLWRHTSIFLTPHIASRTQAESSAHAVIENIIHYRNSGNFRFEVSRTRGY